MNKKVLLIPIKIKGSDNKYGLSPIYQIDAQLKKFLTNGNVQKIQKYLYEFHIDKLHAMF